MVNLIENRVKQSNRIIDVALEGEIIAGYDAKIFCNCKSLKQLRDEVEYRVVMVKKLQESIFLANGKTENRERRVRVLIHEKDMIEQYLRLTDRKA